MTYQVSSETIINEFLSNNYQIQEGENQEDFFLVYTGRELDRSRSFIEENVEN